MASADVPGWRNAVIADTAVSVETSVTLASE